MRRCVIACICLLVGSGFLLAASPAAATCHCVAGPFNTGTLTGHGNTCADAQANLEALLESAADTDCFNRYGAYYDYLCNYSETLNSCQVCSPGMMMSGSAQYGCHWCFVP